MTESNMGDTQKHFSRHYTPYNGNLQQAFELVSYGDFDCDDTYFTKRDGLAQFLIIFTLDGEGELQYNNVTASLTSSTVAVINCNQYHHYKTKSNCNWHFLWLHFSSKSADSLVDFINRPALFVGTQSKSSFCTDYNFIKKMSENMLTYAQTEISLAIHTILTKIVALRATGENSSLLNHKQNLNSAINYMKEHYTQTITIDDLSQISNISKYYFIKLFREMTGITPYRYIILIRIDQSKKLLKHTQLSVSQIAEEAGFCDSKNFITNFKNITGMTPLKFRNLNLI